MYFIVFRIPKDEPLKVHNPPKSDPQKNVVIQLNTLSKIENYPFLIDFTNIIINHKSVSTPCQPNPIFCTIMIIYHLPQKTTLFL